MKKRWTKKPDGRIPHISECKRMIDWRWMTCLGFAISENDDEPIECCKVCRYIETKDYDHPLFGKMRSINEEEAELYEQMKKNHPKVYSNVNVFDL